MAVELQGHLFGHRKAAADLSSSQYLAVKLDSSSEVALAGAGEASAGILQNKPTAGQAAAVQTTGVSKCVFGGTVAAGAKVAADAAGKLVVATVGDFILGIADEGGAADEIGSVLLKDMGVSP